MKNYFNLKKKSKLLLLTLLTMLVVGARPAWAQKSLPYSYGFEDNNLATDGWTTQNPSGLNNSEFGIDPSARKTGSNGFCFSSYNDRGESTQYLISPELNVQKEIELTFEYRASSSSSSGENFKVGYSTTNTDIASFTFDGDEYSTTSSSWATFRGKFPAGTKYIAVYYYSDYHYRLYVDDFSFDIANPYMKPTDVAAALTLGDGTIATLSWTENGTATQWQICLNDDEENLITTNENPFNLTGLTPETTYTAKVRAVVGEEWSKWSDAVSFTPTNEYKWTVNEGTETNQYMPIYGYYVDDITKSQFVIPASSLTSIQGEKITRMTFYASQSSINWRNAQFEVYMAEHDAATLSALADYEAMTKVMNAGSLEVSDGKMVVTLDVPYEYMGGNLLIGFLQTVTGTYVRSDWYGVTATGASIGGYDTNVSQQNFLPKTTFELANNVVLTLAENDDNSSVLTENDGKTADVTLTRTLQTGGWNTFCAPFSTATPSGWTVKELTASDFNSTTGELTLNFGNASSIEAGKPYLVKVNATAENPTFAAVTIANGTSTTPTTYADFVPVMNPTNLTGGDKTVLFITGGNKLTYPSGNGNINGFRAYFQLKGEAASQARAFRMSFDDNMTGIITVLSDEPSTGDGIYTLDGRRIEGQPTQKGVYIVNGKKTIIK